MAEMDWALVMLPGKARPRTLRMTNGALALALLSKEVICTPVVRGRKRDELVSAKQHLMITLKLLDQYGYIYHLRNWYYIDLALIIDHPRCLLREREDYVDEYKRLFVNNILRRKFSNRFENHGN